jgi:quercetin dioxygenase-like cupin family protein
MPSAYFLTVAGQAEFDSARGTKRDLWAGSQLFAGLNCFEPGQSQPVHAHADAEKFYFVVSGKARMCVGSETRVASAGDLVIAPAGVPHGVLEALERCIMLIALAPPPRPRPGGVA